MKGNECIRPQCLYLHRGIRRPDHVGTEACGEPQLSADFWPSYSAFANTDGGTIILGIREKDGKRDAEGLPDVEKTIDDISNSVNNADKISANVLFNELGLSHRG